MMGVAVMSPSASAPVELALSFDEVHVQSVYFLLNILSDSVAEISFCASMLSLGIVSLNRLGTGEYTNLGSCGKTEVPLTPSAYIVQQDKSLFLRSFCEVFSRLPFTVHVFAPNFPIPAVEESLLIECKMEDRRVTDRSPSFLDDCSKYGCISNESYTKVSKLPVNFNEEGRSKNKKFDQWGVVSALKDDDDDDDDDDDKYDEGNGIDDYDEDEDDEDDDDDDDADKEDVEGNQGDGDGDGDEENDNNGKEEGGDEEANGEDGGGDAEQEDEPEEEDDDDDDDDEDDEDEDEDEDEGEPPKKRKK